jgi:hypothetical protein
VSLLNKNPWLTAALLLTLTACGGATSDTAAPDDTATPSDTAAPDDTAAPADTVAPTVSSTTPLDLATSVARDSAITATFNEDMFATTVDASSFTLDKSGNINGTVTFEANTNVATFNPSRELDINAIYTATLGTAITDLSGNPLVTDYNWSFTTAEGNWGTAELIETNTGYATSPQVAVNSNGHAIAVWSQRNDPNNNVSIYANRFNGTDWGTAELIETGDAGNAGAPQIAVDSNGNAIAVWVQYDGANNNIYANRFNGTGWGTAELIETGDAGNAFDPQVALDSSGNAIAVWQQNDGAINNIYANRFNGTDWGTAELIETGDAGNAGTPQIAVDSNGNAIAVWVQYDGANINIYANRFNGTGWGTAELIETGDAGNAFDPQVALDSSGNAIAVWQQNDGAINNIYANRFNGTDWGTAELIETNTGYAGTPQIAVDSNGHAIAVWSQRNDPNNNVSIYANRFNGTDWGTAELIETGDAGNTGTPQVAVDSNGNAIAVWEQYDGANNNIYANRFNGTGWGTAELIETGDSGNAFDPQVALDSSGNAIAVWQQNDGANNNIYANRFK